MYSAIIFCDGFEVFKSEESFTNRSNVVVTKTSEGCQIKIEALDAVALRAMTNSITRLLTIYDRLK